MNTKNPVEEAAKGINVPPKAAEVKRSRFDRRLEKRKKEILDKLVLSYFKERSAFPDPDGNESVQAFDEGEQAWRRECLAFNRGRQPFKLRYEAFSESVEFYMNMENNQIKKTAEENKVKDFKHWFRRAHVWKTRPLTAIYFWLKSLGNAEKCMNMWKIFYTKYVTQKV